MTTLTEIKEWCAEWSKRGNGRGSVSPKGPKQTAEWFTQADRQWQACLAFLAYNGGTDGAEAEGRPYSGQIQAVYEDLKMIVDQKLSSDKWATEYFTTRLGL